MLKWINAFLCYRQQRVAVNGVKIRLGPCCIRCLTGHCSRPLIILLAHKDIAVDIESEIMLFADDCICYREIKDKKDSLKPEGY